MRVYRNTFRGRDGRRQTAAKWYVEFRDHEGRARRLPAFTDKGASQELGRKIQDLVSYRAAGKDPAALTVWIDSLPASIADLLTKWGVLERHRAAGNKSLASHLADYEAHLLACGRDAVYVGCAVAQVRAILDGCGFTFWPEVNAHKVQTFVARIPGRKGELLKARSRNGYMQAFKTFANWAVSHGRIPFSPLATLKALQVTDEEERRALTVDELRRLVGSTMTGPERHGMSGPERALLYRLAVETGLRADELASLTRASFDLTGKSPAVTAKKADTKNRKGADIDLSAELAELLRIWLANKLPAAAAFNMPGSTHTAEMLRKDLADARAAWLKEAGNDPKERERREKSDFLKETDDAGRVVVFHSLRHTRGVWLFEHFKASPREVQELMRVSSMALVQRYTRSFRLAGRDIADRGPDLTEEAPGGAQQATGTGGGDGPAGTPPNSPRPALGALLGASSVTAMHPDAQVAWRPPSTPETHKPA